MQMTGEQRIEAGQALVWRALNDPEVLRACIPGCQSLTKTSETGFAATVKAKVGPVSATFNGEVSLTDIEAPHRYVILGSGKGGIAGFASGKALVSLEPDGAATVLVYQVEAKLGGKIAQIGNRLIDGAAKKLAGQFFDNFTRIDFGPA
jgi:hypothetical protein